MNPDETPILPTQVEQKINWKVTVKEVIIFVAIAFGIVIPFRAYVAEPYLVDGRSMDPTFATGDYLIVDKFSYKLAPPIRNSVVVFNATNAGSPKKSFIKRIIGLPGQTVKIKDNTVTIINSENPDGFTIDQSYVTHTSTGTYQKTLKGDEYYVLGDNRTESYDSRYWGPLQKKYILGKPLLRLFPLNKISIFPGDDKK